MNVQCKWKGSSTKPSPNVVKTAVEQDQEKNKNVIKLKTTDGPMTVQVLLGHGPVVKYSLGHWMAILWLACRVLVYKHEIVLKLKSPRIIYSTCICRYVMFAFITKETLNNDVRIFSRHKSMYIKLIKIISHVAYLQSIKETQMFRCSACLQK